MKVVAIWAILVHTFKEAIKAKWLLTFAALFFFLAINVPTLILYQEGVLPPDYLATYLPGLVTLSFPFIPLLALPMGATSIVDERESGRLQFLLSHPISKSDFLLGRVLGLLLATSTVIFLGFGVAAAITYTSHVTAYRAIAATIVIALTLNAGMLGLALAISIISKKRVTALAVSILAWFVLTIGTYFGFLSFALNIKNGALVVLPTILFNPVEATNIMASMQLGQGLSQLGSTGLILAHYIGGNAYDVLVAATVTWLAAFYTVSFLIFRRQDSV